MEMVREGRLTGWQILETTGLNGLEMDNEALVFLNDQR